MLLTNAIGKNRIYCVNTEVRMISGMSYGAGAASDPRFVDQVLQTKLWLNDQIPPGTIWGLTDCFD